jgi:hypothetical protein
MRNICFILLFVISNTLSEISYCMNHCLTEYCINLNGNVTHECGGCNTSASCNKYDLDYETWFMRHIQFNILSNNTMTYIINDTIIDNINDTITDTIIDTINDTIL